MLALPQEYIGSQCEIKSMSNDPLATGRIIKIDRDALEIVSEEGERMPLLRYRTMVKLFVQSKKHPVRIQMGIVYLSTDNFVRVEEVKPLQDFERRGAFRVSTNVVARLSALMDDAEQDSFDAALAAAPPEQAEEMLARCEFSVRVMDISLTGIRLQSVHPLMQGTCFYLDFRLLDAPMSFCVRVQRLIKMPNGDTQYGCIFFDYSERQMDNLCRQLFQLQRFEKNRRRNMVN